MILCSFNISEPSNSRKISPPTAQKLIALIYRLQVSRYDGSTDAKSKAKQNKKGGEYKGLLETDTGAYRREVENIYSIILGILSQKYFEEVIQPFYEKLHKLNANLLKDDQMNEMAGLFSFLRHIKLLYNDELHLERSRTFISKLIHFFDYKKYKIEVVRAIGVLLGELLMYSYDAEAPIPLLNKWREFISSILDDSSFKASLKKLKDNFVRIFTSSPSLPLPLFLFDSFFPFFFSSLLIFFSLFF